MHNVLLLTCTRLRGRFLNYQSTSTEFFNLLATNLLWFLAKLRNGAAEIRDLFPQESTKWKRRFYHEKGKGFVLVTYSGVWNVCFGNNSLAWENSRRVALPPFPREMTFRERAQENLYWSLVTSQIWCLSLVVPQPRFRLWHVISMEFLRPFLRRHIAGEIGGRVVKYRGFLRLTFHLSATFPILARLRAA